MIELGFYFHVHKKHAVLEQENADEMLSVLEGKIYSDAF